MRKYTLINMALGIELNNLTLRALVYECDGEALDDGIFDAIADLKVGDHGNVTANLPDGTSDTTTIIRTE